jgi:hypothetical protein
MVLMQPRMDRIVCFLDSACLQSRPLVVGAPPNGGMVILHNDIDDNNGNNYNNNSNNNNNNNTIHRVKLYTYN